MNYKNLKDIAIVPTALSLDVVGGVLESTARAAQLGAAKLATLAENEKFKKMGRAKEEALKAKSRIDMELNAILKSILKESIADAE